MTDDQERRVATEIERSHPNWVVLWGCYTRLFWAFPHFLAPQGTIVSAPGPDRLLADMHSVELEARASQQAAAYSSQQIAACSSPPSPAQLPRRLSRGQAQRDVLPRIAPVTDALAVASRQEQKSDPSLVPLPRVPALPVRGTAAAAMPWPPPAAGAQSATRSHDPYAADPYESDPYSSDPYSSDPYESNSAWQS
jgi:hypothetical protein